MKQDETHFGYQTVKASEKASKVANVFKSVAKNYDIMNDVMSFGIHRLWKQIAIFLTPVRSGHTVLDLAGGTGDLAIKLAEKVGPSGKVILGDINYDMLAEGRNRLIDLGSFNQIEIAQCNAECLPFPDNTFDCVTMAFGLRNVTDKDKALKSINRVLKPGGTLLVLEFSKPTYPLFSQIYDFYSFKLLPKMGQLIAKDAESYQYLAESIRMHPDQKTLKQMMNDAGFTECAYHNLTGGIVAIHKGFKA